METTTEPLPPIYQVAGTKLSEIERAAIERALVIHKGNRTHAAKSLGISVRTLHRKLRQYAIPSQ